MNSTQRPIGHRLSKVSAVIALAGAVTAVFVGPAMAQYTDAPPPQDGYFVPYENDAVISVYVDAPLYEPEPIAVSWAPPPMLVDDVPPPPDYNAVWTGGYWTWQGQWVWCAGRWVLPPRVSYVWVQPYYEYRNEVVIFLPGYWSAPDVEFVAPRYDVRIPLAFVAVGVIAGPRPLGPQGIFIPPPPGSRPGIIIPAPIGTPPAVMISAPPVVNVGMRVRGNVEINSHNTTTNDRRATYNVTNVRNVTNVTIEAPATAMSTGRAFQSSVPARAHLAAALAPVVQAKAPVPASRTPVPTFVPGRAVPTLPPAQRVHAVMNTEAARAAAAAPHQREPSAQPAPPAASKTEGYRVARPQANPPNSPDDKTQSGRTTTRPESNPQAQDPHAFGMHQAPPAVQQPQREAPPEPHPEVVTPLKPEPRVMPRTEPDARALQHAPTRPPAANDSPPRQVPPPQAQAAPRADPRAQEEAARAAEAARMRAAPPRPAEAAPHPAANDRAKQEAEDRARRDKARPEGTASGPERR